MKRSVVWAVVALVGTYIFCQALADVAATKMLQIGTITLPAGTFVFTLTFTLRDMIHKRLGKEWARACIVMAGVLNIVMALYLWGMAQIPAPVFFGLGEAWGQVFSLVPSIVIASITAEVVSELIDTEVYHLSRKKFTGTWQFMNVLISNAVSLPIDSLIFGSLAFTFLPPLFGAEAMPIGVALGLVGGQIIWKAIVTVVSLPGIYLTKEQPIV